MDLSFLQITILALIQGITEFLPISSSAHLILPSLLLDWPDQGLTFDVALHLGTLFAVFFYFRRDVIALIRAWLIQIIKGEATTDSKLAWIVIIATIPGAIAGYFGNDFVESYARSGVVLAIMSSAKISFLLAIPIIFGSFLLRALDLANSGTVSEQLFPIACGMLIAGAIAFLCIHYFMQLIERVGFLPFVIYRIGLASLILVFTVVL